MKEILNLKLMSLKRQLCRDESKVDVNEKTIFEGDFEPKVDVIEKTVLVGQSDPKAATIEKPTVNGFIESKILDSVQTVC